jgi:hypothetical protein
MGIAGDNSDIRFAIADCRPKNAMHEGKRSSVRWQSVARAFRRIGRLLSTVGATKTASPLPAAEPYQKRVHSGHPAGANSFGRHVEMRNRLSKKQFDIVKK